MVESSKISLPITVLSLMKTLLKLKSVRLADLVKHLTLSFF